MAITVWKLIRAVAGAEAGRACRRCSEPIPAQDAFGMSEAVRGPCRLGPDT